MKKAALSLLAFGLIGVGAFAQAAAPSVTIGEWGRQLIAVGDNADGSWVATGASWGSTPRIVGLNIQAKTDTAGFSITPSADNGTFGLTDQNKAWINPIPGLTVESGISLETDTWRGVRDFNSYNWLRANGEKGDSITFGRLGNGGQAASDINYNKDGIGAWALLAYNAGPAPVQTSGIGSWVQVGGAYTIPSIGQIKAQYVGNQVNSEAGAGALFGNVASGTAYGAIQVAFNLSAVKDLYEEIGIQIPTKGTDAGYTYQISDLVGYTLDKLTLNGQLIAVGYTDDNGGTAGLGIGGGVGFDYDLGDSVGLGADVRYNNVLAQNGGATDDDSVGSKALTAFTVGITKGYSNGLIGVAFEYSTTGFSFGQGNDGDGHWAIPVRLEYWF